MPVNLDDQCSPGPGANGVLATATIDDLIRELKTRCTACAVVMVVEDEQGEDITVTFCLGSALILLGACEEARWKLLNRKAE